MIEVHIPANLFYPELPGGSMQYFRYGPYLRDQDIKLIVHTIRKPHHEEKYFEIRGIEVHRYTVPSEFGLFQELEFVTERALEAIATSRNQCCLHPLGTMGASVRSVSRLWKARLKGIPTCFHFMMVPVKEPRSFISRFKHDAWIRFLLSPYQKMMMCSHVMGRAFERVAGVSQRRIEPIPNGIDLDVFSPIDAEEKRVLRAKWNLPENDPVVLYVGSVIARKGIEILVEAWQAVIERRPEAKLVIVGSTGARPTVSDPKARSETDRYYGEILDQIERLSDPGSIIFAGEVDTPQDYYRAADLFAFASKLEGLPSVVLESMACATPCVVAPFIGLPADGEEYGVDGVHFMKSSHDPAQLAKDVIDMIEDEEGRLEMGRQAADWIREHQEMSKAAARLGDVYRELVGQG